MDNLLFYLPQIILFIIASLVVMVISIIAKGNANILEGNEKDYVIVKTNYFSLITGILCLFVFFTIISMAFSNECFNERKGIELLFLNIVWVSFYLGGSIQLLIFHYSKVLINHHEIKKISTIIQKAILWDEVTKVTFNKTLSYFLVRSNGTTIRLQYGARGIDDFILYMYLHLEKEKYMAIFNQNKLLFDRYASVVDQYLAKKQN